MLRTDTSNTTAHSQYKKLLDISILFTILFIILLFLDHVMKQLLGKGQNMDIL